jgi:Ferritin-like
MIRLQAKLFADLSAGGRQAVCNALQQAVELEHSTIPVYLYALYSLDAAKNRAIAALVTSVVIEEMLHMTLACNILNALGGSPVLDRPGFIPTYPGPLPGGVEGDLIVHLTHFSPEQVRSFMTIEEPEDPLHFPVLEALVAAPPQTIGQFYAEIARQIVALGDGAFSHAPRHQIGPERMPGSIVVTNVDSARAAIDTIVEQGEGTTESPLEAAGSQEVAHYYRFAEIYYGRRLIKNPAAGPDTPPDQQFIYGGAAVPFDPAGVFPVPADPKAANYPAGSAARHACDTFNYTYTSLLKSLHDTFNGRPDQIDSAIGLMMSLKQLARDMMSGSNPNGVSVGPSFEYQPVNPA